jgi:hypothetical protein
VTFVQDGRGPRRKLPVWAVVKRAYSFPWQYRRVLFWPLAILTAVILLLRVAALLVYRAAPQLKDEADPDKILTNFPDAMSGAAQEFLYSLIAALFSMSLIVGIHRLVLLGEIRRGVAFFRTDGFFGRYILTALLLFIIIFLSYLVIALAVLVAGFSAGLIGHGGGKPGGIVAVILAAIVFGAVFFLAFMILRLQLALPAAAMGEQDRLGLAWRATRSNVLRLLLVWILTSLPILALALAISGPSIFAAFHDIRAGTHPPVQASLTATILTSLITPIQVAVITTMLSLCYDVLVRDGGPGKGHGDGQPVPSEPEPV